MNDRRRLLTLSVLVLLGVSLCAVALTLLHLVPPAAMSRQPLDRTLWLILGNTAVVVIGGAALLLRISQPVLRRLEQSERQLQAAVAALETKAAELASTNDELDEFAYVASHDLKEPLHGISAYCGLLRDEYSDRLDADGRRMTGVLVELCQRLGQQIDDLLAYSRAARKPEYVDIELDHVLDGVLQILAPAIDARRGAVVRPRTLPAVRADATLIGLVFQNLIANGLKFNDRPTPTVEIDAIDMHGDPALGADNPSAGGNHLRFDSPEETNDAPAGSFVTIAVRDNGIGIDPRHHSAVFTLFRRLHARRKYEGTGAGLSIVRRIIESHGGTIWLESQPAAGSTFYFTLPLSPRDFPGISPQTLENIESGEVKPPGPAIRHRLAKVLNVLPGEIEGY